MKVEFPRVADERRSPTGWHRKGRLPLEGPELSGAVVLNFSRHQNHLENVLKHRLLSLVPRCSDSVGLRWGREFACLTSCQVMLMLVVQGSRFEKHRCREHVGLEAVKQNIGLVWAYGILQTWVSQVKVFTR